MRRPSKLNEDRTPVQEWSGRLDLNQRPHAPQACALPGCATSRPLRTVFSVSLAFEKGQDSEKFFVQIEKEFALCARGRRGARRRDRGIFAFGAIGRLGATRNASLKIGEMLS